MDPALQRIAVVGISCAGKTTFSRALSASLGLPHTELDELFWGPDWTPRPDEVFRDSVRAACAEPAWILDGSYVRVRDLVWGRATTLVWLDYTFARIFIRAVRRTAERIVTRKRLFAGNRESLAGIFDPDWIPWWVVRTYHRRRAEYRAALARSEFAHLRVHVFRHPREAMAFCASCVGGSPLPDGAL